MGSEIELTTEVARGSLFAFEIDGTIPATLSEATQSSISRRIIGYEGARQKLLIVDDDVNNRAVLHSTLGTLGFEISEAADGLQAIQSVKGILPDLIVADIRMPQMDGLEFVKTLRQQDDFRDTPVIGVSASAFEDDAKATLSAGYSAFLPKPINLRDLLNLIKRELQLHWVFQEAGNQEANLAHPVVLPPDVNIEILRQAARIGDVESLLNELNQIALLDQSYLPFVIRIRTMADNYQLQDIRALLKE